MLTDQASTDKLDQKSQLTCQHNNQLKDGDRHEKTSRKSKKATNPVESLKIKLKMKIGLRHHGDNNGSCWHINASICWGVSGNGQVVLPTDTRKWTPPYKNHQSPGQFKKA